jgi:hypothetical protein
MIARPAKTPTAMIDADQRNGTDAPNPCDNDRLCSLRY